MARREEKKFTCTVEFTDGAVDRITDAFVDLYYGIKKGVYKGPLLEDKKKDQEPA